MDELSHHALRLQLRCQFRPHPRRVPRLDGHGVAFKTYLLHQNLVRLQRELPQQYLVAPFRRRGQRRGVRIFERLPDLRQVTAILRAKHRKVGLHSNDQQSSLPPRVADRLDVQFLFQLIGDERQEFPLTVGTKIHQQLGERLTDLDPGRCPSRPAEARETAGQVDRIRQVFING